MYHCNHVKGYTLVALSTFLLLCTHHLHLVPQVSHHPKWKPVPITSTIFKTFWRQSHFFPGLLGAAHGTSQRTAEDELYTGFRG